LGSKARAGEDGKGLAVIANSRKSKVLLAKKKQAGSFPVMQ